MPASGELESGQPLFSTNPPPPRKFKKTLPPPINIGMTEDKNYMKCYMRYKPSKFAIIIFMPEIIFVSD